jgi:UDP-glucose 4-epimerase
VDCEQYNSDNTHRLDLEGMKKMLLSLDYVQEQLKEYEAELAKKAAK